MATLPEDEKKSSSIIGMIKDKLKEFLGDELLKTVDLEVYWGGQGAKRNSVNLAYLITNQLAVDTQLESLEPVKKQKNGSSNPKNPPGEGSQAPKAKTSASPNAGSDKAKAPSSPSVERPEGGER